MSRVNRKPEGFSLMELMIVLVVLGILVAVTVPTVVGFQRTARLTGAANTLVTDFRYARSLAAEQRTTYKLTFAAASYSVVRVAPAATVRSRILPRGIKCTASSDATFFPWGLASASTVTFADTLTRNARLAQVVRLTSNGGVSRD